MKGADVASITELLRAHGVALSAVRANRLLIELGLLAEGRRESATRPGVIRTYKVVTEAGLDYGTNVDNPRSPGESAPYWYRDSFVELAARLLAADAGAGDGGPTRARDVGRADADAARGRDDEGGGGSDAVSPDGGPKGS